MGTRSLTYVYDDSDEPNPIVCMYRQHDGYPSGHGKELAEFLLPITIVNGVGSKWEREVANGMGCLSALMVAHFKDGPGGIYLHAPILDRDDWQDYEYHVFKQTVTVTTNQQQDVLFAGSWSEFNKFCATQDENV